MKKILLGMMIMMCIKINAQTPQFLPETGSNDILLGAQVYGTSNFNGGGYSSPVNQPLIYNSSIQTVFNICGNDIMNCGIWQPTTISCSGCNYNLIYSLNGGTPIKVYNTQQSWPTTTGFNASGWNGTLGGGWQTKFNGQPGYMQMQLQRSDGLNSNIVTIYRDRAFIIDEILPAKPAGSAYSLSLCMQPQNPVPVTGRLSNNTDFSALPSNESVAFNWATSTSAEAAYTSFTPVAGLPSSNTDVTLNIFNSTLVYYTVTKQTAHIGNAALVPALPALSSSQSSCYARVETRITTLRAPTITLSANFNVSQNICNEPVGTFTPLTATIAFNQAGSFTPTVTWYKQEVDVNGNAIGAKTIASNSSFNLTTGATSCNPDVSPVGKFRYSFVVINGAGCEVSSGNSAIMEVKECGCSETCFWKLTGNSSVGSSNFLGTKNGADLIIKTGVTGSTTNPIDERIKVTGDGKIYLKNLSTSLSSQSNYVNVYIDPLTGQLFKGTNAQFGYRTANPSTTSSPSQKEVDELKLQVAELQTQVKALLEARNYSTPCKVETPKANTLEVVPTPFANNAKAIYSLENFTGEATLQVSDVTGKVLKSYNINQAKGQIEIGDLQTNNTTIIFNIVSGGKLLVSKKSIKVSE